MVWGFIQKGANRTEHRPGIGDWGMGMRTNYGETRVKNINRNEQIVRVARVLARLARGLGVVTKPHTGRY